MFLVPFDLSFTFLTPPLCRREKAIKDLLARSGPNLDEWMTRGLVGSLKLPMTWVDEAKVSLSRCDPHAYELNLISLFLMKGDA